MNRLAGCNQKTHYGSSMDAFYMGEWGRKMAACVSELIDAGKYPILIYRGMSGTATATAIAVNIKEAHRHQFGMAYVRKKHEKSHGSKIEYSTLNPANREIVWILCDDFLSSGKTALEVIKAVSIHFDLDIDLNNLLFAVSLSKHYSEIADKLNTLESAVSHRISGDKTVKYVRHTHARFIKKQQTERIERTARREAAAKELFDSF
jgi:orotate phosphoribosyltransferase